MRRRSNVATVVLAVAAIICLLVVTVRFMAALVGGAVGDHGEKDPMFAEQEPAVTRPPELMEDVEAWGYRARDASQDWVYQTLTPIGNAEGVQ